MLALFSLVCMLHPDDAGRWRRPRSCLPATLIGIWRHRQIAGPKTAGVARAVGDEREPTQAVTANLASEG